MNEKEISKRVAGNVMAAAGTYYRADTNGRFIMLYADIKKSALLSDIEKIGRKLDSDVKKIGKQYAEAKIQVVGSTIRIMVWADVGAKSGDEVEEGYDKEWDLVESLGYV